MSVPASTKETTNSGMPHSDSTMNSMTIHADEDLKEMFPISDKIQGTHTHVHF